MQQIVISNTTVDFEDFVNQFVDAISKRDSWRGKLTTQTSQTLIELAASLGVFHNGRLLRYYEDAFPETVQSDRGATSIATMQGLRLSRKSPASISVNLTSPVDITLNNYSQFTVNGYNFFNRDQIELIATVPQRVELYQGEIIIRQLTGLGTDFQTVVSREDNFTVSNTDVFVTLNGSMIEKSYSGLWNFKDRLAYNDLTLPDGRLIIQFGSGSYGAIPTSSDSIGILYVITMGTSGVGLTTQNAPVILLGQTLVTGTALSNPTGGGDEKSTWVYKNISSGAAGTLGSAVTAGQYHAMVLNYPGILDAKTQAQRDINPQNKEWMNVIRVTALTETPWSLDQRNAFLREMERQSMYACHFVWQDPIPQYWGFDIDVFCFNTGIPDLIKTTSYNAVVDMFKPQPLILGLDHFLDDISAAIRRTNAGSVSHVIINEPEQESLLASAPYTPPMNYEILLGEGSLSQLVYAYSIAVDTENIQGRPTNWIYPQVVGTNADAAIKITWSEFPGAIRYHIWGRQAGGIGILHSIDATEERIFLDDGSAISQPPPPASMSEAPVRYNALEIDEEGNYKLNIRVHYTSRSRIDQQ